MSLLNVWLKSYTLTLFQPGGEKVIRYYGENCAQLEVDQSIRTKSDTSHPWWYILMNWVLFCSPNVYAKRLNKIWVDQQVNYQYWRQFIQELRDDWQASIIPVGLSYELSIQFC